MGVRMVDEGKRKKERRTATHVNARLDARFRAGTFKHDVEALAIRHAHPRRRTNPFGRGLCSLHRSGQGLCGGGVRGDGRHRRGVGGGVEHGGDEPVLLRKL